MANDTLEQQDTYGIDIRGLVLTLDITQNQLRCRVFRLTHKHACHRQRLVVRGERLHLLGYTKVNQLDMAVGCNHDVSRVNITMDITGIMQRHQARQHIPDNIRSEVIGITLIVVVQLLGKRHRLAALIGQLSCQQVVQHNAVQQFTHHVVVMLDIAQRTFLLYINEAQHLHQIIMANLDGGFPSGSLDGMSRQVAKHELDSHVKGSACHLVDTAPLIHLAHAALA